MYPLGARGSISGPLGHSPVSLGTSWWLAGGIAAADVAGAWQAKGAASLAASYLRLAGDQGYANIDPAVVGSGVAPTWDAVNGWIGDAASIFLNTGIIPTASFTIMARFAGVVPGSFRSAMGTANGALSIRPIQGTVNRAYIFGNGLQAVAGGALTGGTMALAGPNGYANGAPDAVVVYSVFGTAKKIYILASNNNDLPGQFLAGNVQAVVIYKSIIDAAKLAELHTAMMAL